VLDLEPEGSNRRAVKAIINIDGPKNRLEQASDELAHLSLFWELSHVLSGSTAWCYRGSPEAVPVHGAR
jgi:hypothetical protein